MTSARLPGASVLALAALAACSSTYGEASNATDAGGTDAGAANEAGATCGAKRCMRFDDASQAASPFGFDTTTVEPGATLGLVPGPSSANALRVVSMDQASAYGSVRIAEEISTITVRTMLRAGVLVPGNTTSAHLVDVTCAQGDRMDAKLSPDRQLQVQVSAPSATVSPVPTDAWIPLLLEVDLRANPIAKVTRLDTGQSAELSGTRRCAAPYTVTVGATNWGTGAEVGSYEVAYDDVEIDWN